MQFRYQVLDSKKTILLGEIDAPDVKRARLALMQRGYDVLQLEPVRASRAFLKRGLGGLGTVSLKEKMLFVKHLSLMIKSGLVLDEALSALHDQARGKLKAILTRLVEVVRKGNLLADGLAIFPYTFSEFFRNMVRIGEQSGTFETNLINLSVKLRKDHDLKAKLRSALMYPTIVLIALAGLGFTLSIFVLPKLLGFFETLDVDVPLATRIFITAAGFLNANWVLLLVSLIAFVIMIVVANKLKYTKAVTHWLVYHLPLTHQFSKASNLANFCRSMHLLLTGGIAIDESLQIMSRAMSNLFYQERVALIQKSISHGESLSAALGQHTKYFPPIVTKMIHIGEVSGNLAETFEYLAEFYEDDLDYLSKNLSTLIEPVLLVFIGLLVGFIALAIISPIYELTGGIRL